ncbi:hypothetical protein KOI40_07590 [Aestuariicella sp. G3-2]|uniref:hypothetical protein n=1 Tax=Pseudomaricurvus albidus TaxID=2842452 RepID=UPI001C0DF2C5|nr:hypothetical protein [Aestuariicella albida]MBU3069679.1 hypothetical protein [Aestuariicella albida]
MNTAFMNTATALLAPSTELLLAISLLILVSLVIQRVATAAHLHLPQSFSRKSGSRTFSAAASGTPIAILIVTIGFYSLMIGGSSMTQANETQGYSGDPFAPVADSSGGAAQKQTAIPDPAANQAPPITADELIVQTSFMLMTNPQETMQSLKRLGQNEDIKSLLNNPANQRVLNRGNPAEIAQLSEYQQLQKNPDIQKLLRNYETDDPRLAVLLATFWQRSQNLQSSPEFQAVMLDPEIQSQLQAGNPLPLLAHPKGVELIRSLLNPTPGTAP